MDKVVGTRLMLNIGMTLFLAADKKKHNTIFKWHRYPHFQWSQ